MLRGGGVGVCEAVRTLRPFVTRCARLREYVCVCVRHGCCSCVADNPPPASPLLPTPPSAGVTRYQIECSHPPRSRSLKSRAATPEDHPPRGRIILILRARRLPGQLLRSPDEVTSCSFCGRSPSDAARHLSAGRSPTTPILFFF